jgi:serine/threonine protein kinase
MIHQDLKPENILIDAEGTARIIDFGSTKIAGVEEITTPIQRLNLLGTRLYTAPEYLLGEPCSPRSDLFALAVITYELLTGHLPYGEGFDETTIRRLTYTPARQWAPDLPLWVDWALEKALQRNPALRQAELSEFLHDLAEPNPDFVAARRPPILARDPVATWRGLFIASALVNLILLFLLSRM